MQTLHTSHRLRERSDASVESRENEASSTQRPNAFHSLGVKSIRAKGPTSVSSKSTITSQERKVFENIRQKFGGNVTGILSPPIVVQEDSPTKQIANGFPVYDLEVDRILSLFAPEISVERSSDNFEPMQESTRASVPSITETAIEVEPDSHTPLHEDIDTSPPRLPSPAEVRLTTHTVLQKIANSITQCLRSTKPVPEHALWQYLNAEIFPIVTLLQHPLLRPTANSFHRPYQLTLGELTSANPENPLLLPSCLTNVSPQTPVLPLITILYPAATLMAMRNYAAYLPASDYALSLYPSIQNLGTASFLLGANVHFFNNLIQLHWEVYSDFTEIAALLQDMKSAAVPYNSTTLTILKAIAQDGKGGGKDGRAKEWWALTAQRDGNNTLTRQWMPRVEKSIRASREEVSY